MCWFPFHGFHTVLSKEAIWGHGWFNSALKPPNMAPAPPLLQTLLLRVPGWVEGLETAGAPYLWRKTISTLTSSRSLCRKSFRKLETLSRVMCPQTTMCLNRRSQLDGASPALTQHPPQARQRKRTAAGKHCSPPQTSVKAQLPSPEGREAKQWRWQVLRDSLAEKAYGFSPDAAQNPIKSPTVWPSGFMHWTISDIMLVLKCCIIKSLADSYLSLSAHKASSWEIYRMSLGLWHRAYQVMR